VAGDGFCSFGRGRKRSYKRRTVWARLGGGAGRRDRAPPVVSSRRGWTATRATSAAPACSSPVAADAPELLWKKEGIREAWKEAETTREALERRGNLYSDGNRRRRRRKRRRLLDKIRATGSPRGDGSGAWCLGGVLYRPRGRADVANLAAAAGGAARRIRERASGLGED
jgi:hypothetical protein